MREFASNYRNLCPGARNQVANRSLGDRASRKLIDQEAKREIKLPLTSSFWGRESGGTFAVAVCGLGYAQLVLGPFSKKKNQNQATAHN